MRFHALGFLVGIVAAGCRGTIPTEPIAVPTGLRAAQIGRAIVAGALSCYLLVPFRPDDPPGPLADAEVIASCGGWRYEERNGNVWSIENRRAGLVGVDLHRSPHSMQIAVEYDEESVRPKVVASEQLKQGNGKIHTSAVLWIEQLRERIERGLGQAAGR